MVNMLINKKVVKWYKVYYKQCYVFDYLTDEVYEGKTFEEKEYIIKSNSYDILQTDKVIQYRIMKVENNSIWIERLDKYLRKQRNIKLNKLING